VYRLPNARTCAIVSCRTSTAEANGNHTDVLTGCGNMPSGGVMCASVVASAALLTTVGSHKQQIKGTSHMHSMRTEMEASAEAALLPGGLAVPSKEVRDPGERVSTIGGEGLIEHLMAAFQRSPITVADAGGLAAIVVGESGAEPAEMEGSAVPSKPGDFNTKLTLKSPNVVSGSVVNPKANTTGLLPGPTKPLDKEKLSAANIVTAVFVGAVATLLFFGIVLCLLWAGSKDHLASRRFIVR